MNFFNQGIPLGRWFKITVILHWTFLLFAGFEIFGGGGSSAVILENAVSIGLLFAVVLLHEFGHALSCRAVGGEASHIILWPLGGIAFVQPPMNPTAWLITTVCGPLVNAILWPTFFFISQAVITSHYGPEGWSIILEAIHKSGGDGIVTIPGLDWPSQCCVFLWQINKLLLLFNLIPAYPMDGGRLLQEVLWFTMGYRRSMLIAGMVGTVAGASMAALGFGLGPIKIPQIGFSLGGEPNTFLIIIGILAATQSFAIYRRAQEIQEWRKN